MSERLNFAERVRFANEIGRLEEENGKLRELVLDMVDWAYIWDGCDLEDQFSDRMRELGVEI